MSKIGTDLGAVLEDTNVENIQEAMRHVKERADTPGADAFGNLSHRELTAVLRSARMYFAGSTPWSTGMEAVEATSNHMQNKLCAKMMEMLGYGIYVGRQNLDRSENFEKLFTDRGVEIAANLEAMRVALDQEARSHLMEFMGKQVAGAVRAMGFHEVQPHQTHHVWDVWFAALAGGSATVYRAGYQLGSKWREEEVLNGILEATQSEASNEGLDENR